MSGPDQPCCCCTMTLNEPVACRERMSPTENSAGVRARVALVSSPCRRHNIGQFNTTRGEVPKRRLLRSRLPSGLFFFTLYRLECGACLFCLWSHSITVSPSWLTRSRLIGRDNDSTVVFFLHSIPFVHVARFVQRSVKHALLTVD